MNEQYDNLYDQLKETLKINMILQRELDATKKLLSETLQDLEQAQDELVLALEAVARVGNR